MTKCYFFTLMNEWTCYSYRSERVNVQQLLILIKYWTWHFLHLCTVTTITYHLWTVKYTRSEMLCFLICLTNYTEYFFFISNYDRSLPLLCTFFIFYYSPKYLWHIILNYSKQWVYRLTNITLMLYSCRLLLLLAITVSNSGLHFGIYNQNFAN